jgi:erythromycin esterase-like protein
VASPVGLFGIWFAGASRFPDIKTIYVGANMTKLTKIEKEQQAVDQAKEQAAESFKNHEKIISECRDLIKKMRSPSVDASDIVVIKNKLRVLENLESKSRIELNEKGKRATILTSELYSMTQRLKRAHENLEAIANPPGWGLGEDYTRDDIKRGKLAAEKTIKELEG